MKFEKKVEIIKQYTYVLEKPFVDHNFNDREIQYILELFANDAKYMIGGEISLGYLVTTGLEVIVERNPNNDLVISTTNNLQFKDKTLERFVKELGQLIHKMRFHKEYENHLKNK